MESVHKRRAGLTRRRRSTLGKIAASLAAGALAVAGLAGAGAAKPAQAIESQGQFVGGGWSAYVKMPTKQALQVECFSKIASGIDWFEPWVSKDLYQPQVVASSLNQFTPALSGTSGFMQVQQKGAGSKANIKVSMMNTGQMQNLYKFVLYFKTPTANPRLNLAGGEGASYVGGVLQSSAGLSLTFSEMKSWYWSKPIANQGITRISGIDAAPDSTYRIEGNTIKTDDIACDGTGPSGACTAREADAAQVKSKVASSTPAGVGATSPLRGTIELNTGGVPVSKVTVTLGAKFYYNTNPAAKYTKDSKVNTVIAGIALQPQFRSEVASFQRTLGMYGHAMHAMPFIGNDNLHFGKTIQEGNRDRYTTEMNSGTDTDNSDAGYDAPLKFYFENDKTKSPVTSVSSKDAGKWLMLETSVASLRTDATAYVFGFIDWTGTGDFAKVDKGKSTLGCVSKGNGKVVIKWKVPSKVTTGPINMRLRTAYDCCEIDKPTTPALSGEVEDWPGILNVQKNNLKVAKSVVAGSVARSGETVTYELSVANLDGKATGRAVTVTDTLPAELRDVKIEAPASYGTATVSGGTVTWTIPAGLTGPASVRVSGVLADGVPTKDVANTARLLALCDPGNCEATATFQANPKINAHLALTHEITAMTQDPARAGTMISYRVTMGYEGDVPLNDYTFTQDLIPDNADWTCTTPLTSSINPGYSNTCSASYTVSEADMNTYWDTGELPATATIAGKLSVAPFTEVTQSASVNAPLDTTTARVKLTGTVTADAASAVPGQTVTFTITATNSGQVTATGVQLTNSLNNGSPVNIDPAACTWPSTPSQLAPGDTVTCTVTYRATNDDAGSEVSDQASVTALDGSAPYGPVDLGKATVPVNAATLTITKTNSLPGQTPSVSVGQEFDYLITVANTSDVDATNVRVRDLLPTGLDFAPASQEGWTFAGREATSDPVTVPAKNSVTLHLGVVVTQDSDGSLLNLAWIDGYTSSLECAAKAAAKGCTRDDRPPFSTNSRVQAVKESDVPEDETVEVGHKVLYTITAKNVSGLEALNVRIHDKLPPNMAVDNSVDQPGWTCTDLDCYYDTFDLAGNTDKEITLQAVAVSTIDRKVRNTVVVQSYDMDGGSPSGLAASATPGTKVAATEVPIEMCLTNPDLKRCGFAEFAGIVARGGVETLVSNTAPAEVSAGQAFYYQILAINASSKPSSDFSMTAVLPAGLSFEGTQDPVWKVDGNTATLTPAVLPAASATSFRIKVKVNSGAAGILQLFTLSDGVSLQTCQADWAAPGCGADRRGPVVGKG